MSRDVGDRLKRYMPADAEPDNTVSEAAPKKRFGLSDLAFYAFMGFLGLFIFGAIGSLLESDEAKAAREARRQVEQHEREAAAQERARLDAAAARRAALPPLQLRGARCETAHGYITYSGMVHNAGDVRLDRLQAIGTFHTRSGDFVTSARAMIDYQPLLPGQTSPFKVMARANPAIDGCRLSFATISGSVVAHR